MLSERVYSVLIVSSTPSFIPYVTQLLPGTTYYPVKSVTGALQARRQVIFRTYDIVLINSPLEDGGGIELARDLSGKNPSSILLLSPGVGYSEAEAALRGSGVYIVKKPLSLPLLSTALSWLCTTCDRVGRISDEKVKIEEKMEEIKLVNRAKSILMNRLMMSENDAQRYIVREAMDKCISKKEEAVLIINTYDPVQ